MKLQFDAEQPCQIDAVNAILQTFDTELFGSVAQTELGIGNRLLLSRSQGLKVSRSLRRPPSN